VRPAKNVEVEMDYSIAAFQFEATVPYCTVQLSQRGPGIPSRTCGVAVNRGRREGQALERAMIDGPRKMFLRLHRHGRFGQ
jgi:hypothetical protein